jgi:hypothetical protein
MRGFLKMFLVVGLLLNSRGCFELARWHAQDILGNKLMGNWTLVVELPVWIPALRSMIFAPYKQMTVVPFALPILITPRFLSFPIFWLWVILSVLYVVLPQRAWGWAGHVLHRTWTKVRRTRET